jgi:hypothetical protein
MKNLLFSFGNSKNKINYFKEQICRGAKRKTERTPVLPCDSLINIIKSRQDPVILPDEYYPPWLLNIPSKRVYNRANDFELGAYMGNRLPDPEIVPGLFKFIDIARKKKHVEQVCRFNQNKKAKALKSIKSKKMIFNHPDDVTDDEGAEDVEGFDDEE